MKTVRSLLNEAVQFIALDCPTLAQASVLDALELLNASAPQCLDNPPHCSHRLVPDPPLTEKDNDGV